MPVTLDATIAVIDDSPLDTRIAQIVISDFGFINRTLAFSSAEEALQFIKSNGPESLPDIIFLDINMPQTDGFGFLEQFQRLPRNRRKSRIVMLTSSMDPSDYSRAMSFDCVEDFITKPLTRDILRHSSFLSPEPKKP